MPELNKQIKKVPAKYRKYLLADFGGDILQQIADKNKFDMVKLFDLTGIVLAIFVGQNKVIDLPKLLKEKLKVQDKKANELAIEIAAKRLLVADEYFKGAVSRFLKKMGENPVKYQDFVKDYIAKTNKEIKAEKKRIEDEKYVPPKKVESNEPNKNPFDFKTKEDAVNKMKELLHENVLLMLTTETVEVKAALNFQMIDLLIEDQSLQKEFINALASNEETIGEEKIVYNNEKVEPTVENWISELVLHLDLVEGQNLSSIKKAKYYAESPNVAKLSHDDKDALDKLFDLYENLYDFYDNAQKMEYGEIQVYPLTQKEIDYLQEKYYKPLQQENKVGDEKPKEVSDYYKGDEKQEQLIETEKKKIIEQTNQEAGKVAQYFYDNLLKRNRISILASLQILVEIGSLDNLLAKDKKFQELLLGYYNRNNLPQEQADFEKDPTDHKFVKHFLKYLLMERLAMDENEAARIGVHISNIYREQGLMDLSQMAYFDLEKKNLNGYSL